MSKSIDVSLAWKDAASLWRSNVDMALAIGGVFFLLPALLIGWFGTDLGAQNVKSVAELSALVREWLNLNWYWLLLNFIFSMIGTMSLYLLVLNPERPTVKDTLVAAISLLPAYFVFQLLVGLATGLAALAFIIPGIYLAVKFMFGGPVIAAEGVRSPVAAMRRSWVLTKNNSVMIFIFLLLLFVVAMIGMTAIDLAFNVPLALVLGDSAKPVGLLISATIQVVVSIFFMFVTMAIYRQLANNQA